MDIKDIVSLANAGFTKDEIAKITTAMQPQATPQAQPQATPQAQTQATPQAQPQATPQAQPQATPQAGSIEAIMAQIATLTQAVQANALGNTSIPQQTETVQDVLAQIIAPKPVENK